MAHGPKPLQYDFSWASMHKSVAEREGNSRGAFCYDVELTVIRTTSIVDLLATSQQYL
jgi:hypothetical protein